MSEPTDFAAAAAMFGDESYWRDLVSFTWNLKTAEGREQIREMLAATAPNTDPSNWQLIGEGSEAGGVTEGWFTFETATSRGKGLLRLIGGSLFPGWQVLLAPLLEAALWPIVGALLLAPQRRAPNPDANRPL